MTGLTLTLLGPPSLARDEDTVRLRSRKCVALLAYLAATDKGHARAHLSTLLWPDSDGARAQASLRYALWSLRETLDGAWLLADRETVALDQHSAQAIDVVRFRHLLRRRRAHGHPSGDACPECLDTLTHAVELYQGDFMAGFTLRDSLEFDDWQSLETQNLRRELAEALEGLACGRTAQGEVEVGIAHAQRWLALDPLHEGAHRCLMRLYAASGQRSDALRQYEACAQALQEKLAVPPDGETTALYHAIRAGLTPGPITSPQATHGPPAPRYNLPPQPTPFVGRERELAQITQLLGEPTCRLLSLLGPGGIGKTRLAIQAAQAQSDAFPDGVHFGSLAPVESPELLPSTIMEGLGVSPTGTRDPKAQLLNYLRDKRLLLILDNFEHLLEAATLVSDMLGVAPGLRVLVTSRQRLNLLEEWMLPLRGLRYPPAKEADTGAIEDYDAVELFLQRARRVRPGLSLELAGPHWVAHICHLVQGMPLAIELAAPWMRVMGCQEIALSIEEDLGFLSSGLRDMPQRHRSMCAVFDHSWGMLPPEEQRVLGKLSVFRGGFLREAAEEVAGASLEALAGLADKSWLRATPSGRYELHELVRQYAQEQLSNGQPEEDRKGTEAVRDRHCRYYAAFLQMRETQLLGWGQKEAFQEILEEMDNVWAAWNWAVERGDVGSIGQCVRALEEVAELRGWHSEIHRAIGKAADRLRRQLGDTRNCLEGAARRETQLVLAEALCSQCFECLKLGLHSEGRH